MSPKRKATTVHGEVEYEVVECSSCGNEVAKEDAKRFVIGDQTKKTDWGGLSTTEYHFNNEQEGWACEYCRNDQLVDFPYAEWKPTVNRLTLSFILLVFTIGMGVGSL